MMKSSFGYYIWPTWVVWGFDRVLRLARYFIINIYFKPQHSEGTVSLITSDSLRLTLTRRFPLGWKPGQHAFLAFPTISTVPVESHPFTIASIPSDDLKEEQSLVFIIKRRDGLTRNLFDYAAAGNGVKVPVYIDGPYGAPPDLAPYLTCILVAGGQIIRYSVHTWLTTLFLGGTGVSYTLPLLVDLVK